jgi:hypothetical protein
LPKFVEGVFNDEFVVRGRTAADRRTPDQYKWKRLNERELLLVQIERMIVLRRWISQYERLRRRCIRAVDQLSWLCEVLGELFELAVEHRTASAESLADFL